MVNSGERKTKAFSKNKSNKVESLTKEGESPVDFFIFKAARMVPTRAHSP